MNLERGGGDKWPSARSIAGPTGLRPLSLERTEAEDLLQLFRAARKPDCSLCGSSQWLAAQVVTVERAEMAACAHVSARSPCGHVMNFTERTLRQAPRQHDRRLLRRCA
jgi:hypothetical protein